MCVSHLSRREILFRILGASSVARLSTVGHKHVVVAVHPCIFILSFSPSVTFRTQTSRWRELPAWKRTDLSPPPPPRPSPSHPRTCSVRSRSWPAQASLRGVSTMRTQHCGAPLSPPHSSFSPPPPLQPTMSPSLSGSSVPTFPSRQEPHRPNQRSVTLLFPVLTSVASRSCDQSESEGSSEASC